MTNKERKKEISKQAIPTKEECLAFYKELTNLASARFVPYYKMAIKALEQEPCEDCISRKEVTQSRPEWLSEDVERDTDEQLILWQSILNSAIIAEQRWKGAISNELR